MKRSTGGSDMMRTDTKLAEVRAAMTADDWDKALQIAARFQRLGPQRVAIQRAADILLRPDFYRQLGYDVEAVRAQGIAALKDRFSKSWNDARSPKSEE
jgi:hypothetical protein